MSTTHALRVTARHPDRTLCPHGLTATGKATASDCPGWHDYLGTCGCGWQLTDTTRAVLEDAHATHSSRTSETSDQR